MGVGGIFMDVSRRLPGGLTSIHHQHVTGDIVRGGRSEKHSRSFQVMFIAKTPQRNVGEKKRLMALQDAVRHVCGKPAGSNCIYLNVVTCPFAGQVFGKTDDSTLAGVIANGWKFRRSPTQSSH